MARVFIDLGVLNGQSIQFFRLNHPQGVEFEYVGFECLPGNLARLRARRLPFKLIEAAAWVHNGKVRFHPGKPDGSSVYATKTTGRVRPDVFIDVPCIDFAEFLRPLVERGNEISIKMNIEGAEYPLIEHLHAAGLVPGVFRWYMCWHWHKIQMAREEHDRVEALLPKWYPWAPGKPGSVEAFRASLC